MYGRLIRLAIAGAVAGALWFSWSQLREGYVAEGRRDGEVERKRLDEARVADIAHYVVSGAQRAAALEDKLRTRELEVERLRGQRPRGVPSHVTPLADARCIVPDGFVRYHDATVPRAAGRPAVPGASPGLVDRPSGVQLSRVEAVVASNYDACQLLAERPAALRKWCLAECAEWDRRWGTDSNCARTCAGSAPRDPRSPETKGR